MMKQDKFIEAMKLLDNMALEMKMELNKLSIENKSHMKNYEAELAIKYNFLCEVIWKLEELEDS